MHSFGHTTELRAILKIVILLKMYALVKALARLDVRARRMQTGFAACVYIFAIAASDFACYYLCGNCVLLVSRGP